MVKKIISAVGAVALLAAFPGAALAQSTNEVTDASILSLPYPKPVPFEVTPGHPLHLQGCGGVKAEGKGFVHFSDVNGEIYLAGKGALAVEDSDLGKATITGFHHKAYIGHWVVYIGQGKIKAAGNDLDIAFHGKGSTSATGCGSVTFKGTWKGVYWRIIRVWPVPIPEPLPINLEGVLSEIA